MSDIEVIGLGALNVDNIYRVSHILKDGEALIDEMGSFPGGSAANTIYGLARLGLSTGFIGAVGDDAAGRLLIQDFNKVGVDTSQIIIEHGVKSGSTLCLSPLSGKRSIYIMPGANNHLTIDDIDLSYINAVSLLHISSFADDRQFRLLPGLVDGLAPSVKVSFSPGELYANKGIEPLSPILGRTYVLFINQSEMKKLTGKDTTEGAEVCLGNGCQIVVVTLGKGKRLAGSKATTSICYIRDTNREYLIEPVGQIENTDVDTTGAGDAFATGFLYGLMKGKGLEECGRLGDIAAQFCISQLGARQGLPIVGELAHRYYELYAKQL